MAGLSLQSFWLEESSSVCKLYIYLDTILSYFFQEYSIKLILPADIVYYAAFQVTDWFNYHFS